MTIATPYEDLLAYILHNGADKGDRTGTGTRSIFGAQMRFNLHDGFPLITTKKVHFKSIVHELLWFLRGDTNIKYLNDNGVTIWDEWANDSGELGRVYGAQWRSWFVGPDMMTGEVVVIDQIANAVKMLQTNPDSRRNIVTAWDPAEVDSVALPPCHLLFQFYAVDNRLSCQLYQRSADMFLGVPFNIASYALLTHMMAEQAGMDVGEFIWTGGDCHIYNNHVDQVVEQLLREPRPYPQIHLTPDTDIFDYAYEDVQLIGYNPHPAIKAPVAI